MPVFGYDEVEATEPVGFTFLPSSTNNSMPLANKLYDPPAGSEFKVITAYTNDLGAAAKQYREGFRPIRRGFVRIFFRVRRRNFEYLLWQLLASGVIKKESIYSPQSLPYWTLSIGVQLGDNFPMGRVIDAIKVRLGISNPGLRFCIDGFFGMINYTDIFGNTTDVCPWMEVSHFSTALSLHLQDGDNVFISIASVEQIDNVLNWRKKRLLESNQKHAKSAQDGESDGQVFVS